jgi:hypothetical protein
MLDGYLITHDEMIGIVDAFMDFDSKQLKKIMDTVRVRTITSEVYNA